jgi:hypothetical protein
VFIAASALSGFDLELLFGVVWIRTAFPSAGSLSFLIQEMMELRLLELVKVEPPLITSYEVFLGL